MHSDFVAGATRGAMAVIDGNVMAINPGEESKMQMFIWNNIFFSLGFDVRDHYKELGGDAAAFVAPVSCLFSPKVYCNNLFCVLQVLLLLYFTKFWFSDLSKCVKFQLRGYDGITFTN